MRAYFLIRMSIIILHSREKERERERDNNITLSRDIDKYVQVIEIAIIWLIYSIYNFWIN